MKYSKLIFILFVFIPFLSFGQNTPVDTTHKVDMLHDCDDDGGRIFTKVEIPPSIKKGTVALSDSISNYIANKNTSFKDGTVLFIFIVTAKSHLVEIRNESGQISNEAILKHALLFYSSMWIPARQNTRIVCAYARCEMKFENNKLTIKVY